MSPVGNSQKMTEARTDTLEEMLIPRIDVSGVVGETDIEKINEIAFELYQGSVERCKSRWTHPELNRRLRWWMAEKPGYMRGASR